MKILILGATGQLGSALMNEFGNHLLEYDLVGLNSKNTDITNKESINNIIFKLQPNLLINCVAHTNVEQAELEPNLAFDLNVAGTDNIVRACILSKCGIVQISSDYVFGSRQRKVITENDEPNPLNAYGISKLWSEMIVKNNMPKAKLPWYIVRSSSLYGRVANTTKGTFILNMLKKLKDGQKVYLNNIHFMSPTYVSNLAYYIRHIIKKESGVYHASNFGTLTPFDFVREAVNIINKEKLATGYDKSNIILDNNIHSLVERPRFSFLGTEKNIGVSMPLWNEALTEFLMDNKDIL